jgi:hypothetical protein
MGSKKKNILAGGFNLRPPGWLTPSQLKKWREWRDKCQQWWDAVVSEERTRLRKRKAGY